MQVVGHGAEARSRLLIENLIGRRHAGVLAVARSCRKPSVPPKETASARRNPPVADTCDCRSKNVLLSRPMRIGSQSEVVLFRILPASGHNGPEHSRLRHIRAGNGRLDRPVLLHTGR